MTRIKTLRPRNTTSQEIKPNFFFMRLLKNGPYYVHVLNLTE